MPRDIGIALRNKKKYGEYLNAQFQYERAIVRGEVEEVLGPLREKYRELATQHDLPGPFTK
jgi:hypothetical protein